MGLEPEARPVSRQHLLAERAAINARLTWVIPRDHDLEHLRWHESRFALQDALDFGQRFIFMAEEP
jgi:hypothetical protein